MHRHEDGPECVHSQKIHKHLVDIDKEREIEALIQYVREQSVTTASAYRTLQTFQVTAHKDDNELSQSVSRFTFTIQPPKNIADDPGEVEAPNEKGTLLLMQRLASDALSSKDKYVDKHFTLMTDELQQMRQTFRELISDILQAKVTTEALLDRKAEREWKIEKERKDHAMWEQLRGFAMNVGGAAVVQKLKEKNMLPQTTPAQLVTDTQATTSASSEASDGLLKLVSSMTTEQLVWFVGNMTPQQSEEIGPLLQEVLPKLPPEKVQAFVTAATQVPPNSAASTSENIKVEEK